MRRDKSAIVGGACGGMDIDEQLFSENIAVDEELFDVDEEDEQLLLEHQLINDLRIQDVEESDNESVE